MADIKLFHIASNQVKPVLGTTEAIERSVQVLFEKNLEALLGVRFLTSEFTTTHGGRIDTLGLDENGSPVILEYKRATNENVINQGLFYLDWLMDHKKDFQWLVLEKLGKEAADDVDWSAPRLICIAGGKGRRRPPGLCRHQTMYGRPPTYQKFGTLPCNDAASTA
jgi:hypothetical protein